MAAPSSPGHALDTEPQSRKPHLAETHLTVTNAASFLLQDSTSSEAPPKYAIQGDGDNATAPQPMHEIDESPALQSTLSVEPLRPATEPAVPSSLSGIGNPHPIVALLQDALDNNFIKEDHILFQCMSSLLLRAYNIITPQQATAEFYPLMDFAETILFTSGELGLNILRGLPGSQANRGIARDGPAEYMSRTILPLPGERAIRDQRDLGLFCSGMKTTGMANLLLLCMKGDAPSIEYSAEAGIQSADPHSTVVPPQSITFIGTIKQDGFTVAPALTVHDGQILGLREPLTLEDIQPLLVSYHSARGNGPSPTNTQAILDIEQRIRILLDQKGYVTDAVETLACTLDGRINLALATEFTSSKGSWGEVLQYHNKLLPALMTCLGCLEIMIKDGQVNVLAGGSHDCVSFCDKFCPACSTQRAVCESCQQLGHKEFQPTKRQCSKCADAGSTCVAFYPLISVGDSLSKQQTMRTNLTPAVMAAVAKQQSVKPPFLPLYQFSVSDPPHDAKLLRNHAFWWWLYLDGHLVTIRVLVLLLEEGHAGLKTLSRSVLRCKDMQDLETLNRLCDSKVVLPDGYMVKTLVPEFDTYWVDNQEGAVVAPLQLEETHLPSWYIILDVDSTSTTPKRSILRAMRLHSPVSVFTVWTSDTLPSSPPDSGTSSFSGAVPGSRELVLSMSLSNSLIVLSTSFGRVFWAGVVTPPGKLKINTLLHMADFTSDSTDIGFTDESLAHQESSSAGAPLHLRDIAGVLQVVVLSFDNSSLFCLTSNHTCLHLSLQIDNNKVKAVKGKKPPPKLTLKFSRQVTLLATPSGWGKDSNYPIQLSNMADQFLLALTNEGELWWRSMHDICEIKGSIRRDQARATDQSSPPSRMQGWSQLILPAMGLYADPALLKACPPGSEARCSNSAPLGQILRLSSNGTWIDPAPLSPQELQRLSTTGNLESGVSATGNWKRFALAATALLGVAKSSSETASSAPPGPYAQDSDMDADPAPAVPDASSRQAATQQENVRAYAGSTAYLPAATSASVLQDENSRRRTQVVYLTFIMGTVGDEAMLYIVPKEISILFQASSKDNNQGSSLRRRFDGLFGEIGRIKSLAPPVGRSILLIDSTFQQIRMVTLPRALQPLLSILRSMGNLFHFSLDKSQRWPSAQNGLECKTFKNFSTRFDALVLTPLQAIRKANAERWEKLHVPPLSSKASNKCDGPHGTFSSACFRAVAEIRDCLDLTSSVLLGDFKLSSAWLDEHFNPSSLTTLATEHFFSLQRTVGNNLVPNCAEYAYRANAAVEEHCKHELGTSFPLYSRKHHYSAGAMEDDRGTDFRSPEGNHVAYRISKSKAKLNAARDGLTPLPASQVEVLRQFCRLFGPRVRQSAVREKTKENSGTKPYFQWTGMPFTKSRNSKLKVDEFSSGDDLPGEEEQRLVPTEPREVTHDDFNGPYSAPEWDDSHQYGDKQDDEVDSDLSSSDSDDPEYLAQKRNKRAWQQTAVTLSLQR